MSDTERPQEGYRPTPAGTGQPPVDSLAHVLLQRSTEPLVVHQDGRVIAANPAAVALFQAGSAQAITRKELPTLFEGESSDRVRGMLAHGFRRDATDSPVAASLITPDGSTVDVELDSVVVLLHGASAVLTSVRDVSVQRRAEAQLRLAHGSLRAIPDPVIITNRAGVIAWTNPAFFERTGYRAPEVRDRTPGQLVKSGWHAAAFYRALWDTILTGNEWGGVITNRRKDGALTTDYTTITPLRNERGDVTHFLGVKH